MSGWLAAITTVLVVVPACYFTAMCLVSAFRGEPIFRWRRR